MNDGALLALDAPATAMHVPDPAVIAGSQMTAFMHFITARTGCTIGDQAALHDFSVRRFRDFWRSFLLWSAIAMEGSAEPACIGDDIEHARFFPDVRLNYAEVLLGDASADDGRLALVAVHDDGRSADRLTRGELRRLTSRAAAGLRQLGVAPGDRVVAVLPNDADAVIAALACAAIGAVFASAAPDMAAPAVLNRFSQLEPKVLICPAQDASRAAGRSAEIAGGLPTLHAVVMPGAELPGDLAGLPVFPLVPAHLPLLAAWHRFPFNHPLFILFSSGTTGAPKCIVHGAGGTLLEHLKEHRLHGDLRPHDVLFFQTSCAWMMWNWQLSALATGAQIVLYDGAIAGAHTLWDIVAAHRVTVFGTSPPYLKLCEEQGLPRYEVPGLRAVLSTGSILFDDQFDWLAENVRRVPLQSISGGTDIIGCFVLGSPNLPVYRGEAQCRSLGLDVQAIGPSGAPGELVCCNPFPSRPLGFWGDRDGSRFHAAYFSQHPGCWTHGDFISFTPHGSARLHGRSDGVMNIRGIRIGPAEIYAALQDLRGIKEAMAVEQAVPEEPGGARIVLLLVLQPDVTLDAAFALTIRKTVGRKCSAAHVPATIADVPALPMTHSGKRSESAARAAVNGVAVQNLAALANPECLDIIARHPAVQASHAASHASPVPGRLLAAKGSPAAPAALPGDTPERRLQAIWQEAFGFGPIGVDDDFFELGGHSLLAMTIVARIRECFHRSVPMTALFQAPTIAALALLLHRPADAGFTCLVPVLPGEGRPFFLVHGLSGTVLEQVRLLTALRGAAPVMMLQAAGLDPDTPPQRSVEAMAERYLAEVRDAQPHGPYALGGFSFGGLVAYEMARRLLAAGETVDLLALIDTGVHTRNLTRRERLAFRGRYVAAFRHAVARDPREALAVEWDYVANAIRLRLGRPARWRDAQLLDLPPLLQSVRAACQVAYTAYRPSPFPGRLVFIRALEPDPRVPDPLTVWQRLAEVEVVPVEGRHLDLVRPPHVAAVGAALAQRLAARDGMAAPQPALTGG